MIPLNNIPVSDVYNQIRSIAEATQQNCLNIQAAAAVGPVRSDLLLMRASCSANLTDGVNAALSNTALATTLVSYIQAQSADPTLDVASSITASLTALQAVIAAIVAEFPRSADGTLADRTMDGSGRWTVLSIPVQAIPRTLAAIPLWLATIS